MKKQEHKISIKNKESDLRIYNRELGVARIFELIKRLTDKFDGCPWDQVQTNYTLAKYTIEEAYELADSVENRSPEDTCKELGDLLFNILFHIHISAEKGLFNLDDVINETINKMVSRHPHVFEDKKINNIIEVNRQWEQIKQQEKKRDSRGRIEQDLHDVSKNIPALTYSTKIQKKLSNVGFDWDASFEIINKIYEEIDEFIDADENNNDKDKLDEIGDILFSVTNLARYANIDPETALRSANFKFVNRVIEMERLLNRAGKELKDTSKKELNRIWDEIKHRQ